MRKIFWIAAMAIIGLVISSPASAQQSAQIIEDFKASYPGIRITGAMFNQHEGPLDEAPTSTMVYGVPHANGATAVDSATGLVSELRGLLGTDIGELTPRIQSNGQPMQGLMTDKATGQPKFNIVRLDQHVGGIPVFRSGIGVMVRNEAGNPAVLSTFDVRELDGFMPGVDPEAEPVISRAIRRSVVGLFDGQPVMRSVLRRAAPQPLRITSIPEYVVFAGVETTQEPELAIQFMATRGSITTYPDYQKRLIIASVETGEILHSEQQIFDIVDVSGSVSGRATDGLASLECDPEVAFGLPYAAVNVNGGADTFADANGDFTIPFGGSGSVTVNSKLSGQFFEVFDQSAGGSTPQISLNVNTPGPADFLHNPTNNNENATANVNCYLEANVCRDYLLSFEPFFPTIANQTGFDVNTNIGSNCNAFYDGSSINFYTSGGGCNNTAFADVIYHEYGHHMVQVTGNGQGQFGEGASDCVGVLMQDEPILGAGFTGNCNSGIRNAQNTIQYPCGDAIHTCGQLISGCVWDLRNELIVSEPSNYRDIGSSLFFGMLIMRGQMAPGSSTIEPNITVFYLTLDDDDGNIGNGTPHYAEIASAFANHNMDAPPIDAVVYTFPTGRPTLVSPSGGVEFEVDIDGVSDTPIASSATLWVDSGSGFTSYPMTEVSADRYAADFPATTCGTSVQYYMSIDTVGGLTAYSPADAPAIVYTARSGDSVISVFEDDFETSTGWAVSGDAGDGQWNRGVPVGGGDRGDPASDGDGSGSCYLTDNVDGNSDVDGGSTILTSPVFDATTTQGDAWISYQRWYSNNFGNSPFADVFVVEISNNGGASWTNLETVGPGGAEASGGWFSKDFRVADVITPTNNMRIRFNASDLGDGSVVEAGVDGFKVEVVVCGPTVTEVTPTTVIVTKGTYVSGGSSDLGTSDNSDFSVARSSTDVQSRTEFELMAASPTANPSEMEVTLEGSVFARSTVNQTIELFNYNTSSWEQVFTGEANRFSDTTVTVEITGDLSRFVDGGSNNIEARVRYQSPAGRQNFTSNTDQFIWTITD